MLAYHYARADDSGKAQEYLFKAGDQAGGIAADLEALEHYRAAVSILKRSSSNNVDSFMQAELDWKIGEALFRLGHYDDSLQHLTQALKALGIRYPRSRRVVVVAIANRLLNLAWRHVARRWGWASSGIAATSDPPLGLSSLALVEALVNIDYYRDPTRFVLGVLMLHEHAQRYPSSPQYVFSLACLGLICDSLGLYGIGERLHDRAIAISEQLGDAKALGYSHLLHGFHAYSVGRFTLAHENLSKAIEHFNSIGDLRQWTAAMGVRMGVLTTMGDSDWMMDVDAMLEMAESAQDDQALAWSLGWAGRRDFAAGDYASSIGHFERAHSLARSLGDYRTQAMTLADIAIGMAYQGNIEGAMPLLKRFFELLDTHRIVGVLVSRSVAMAAEAYLHALESETRPNQRRVLSVLAKRACARVTLHGRRLRDDSASEALRLNGIYMWLVGRPKQATEMWVKGLRLASRIHAKWCMSKIRAEMEKRLGSVPDNETFT